jgi:hypothetical protein
MRTSLAVGWFDKHQYELGTTATLATLGFVLWMLECIGPEHEPGAYHPIGKDVNESPFNTANAYSRWTFYWMGELMKLGARRPLEEEDVYVLGTEDQAEVLTEKLERAAEKHSSLWVALGAAYGSTYVEAAVLKVIQDILAFAQPQFLRWFLAYISLYQAAISGPTGNPDGPSPLKGFTIVAGMFMCAVVQTIVLHQVSNLTRIARDPWADDLQYFDKCYRTGMRIRSGLVALIYKKSLILSNEERKNMPTGDMVNLASVDAMRMQDLCTYGLIAISGPFQITLAFISLYNLLGWSAFVGVAVMIVSIPINTVSVPCCLFWCPLTVLFRVLRATPRNYKRSR